LLQILFLIEYLFFSKIPGVSEIILGAIGASIGIIFTDGAIIKLTIRLLNYFSILFNSGLYFVVSFYDKNKFVEV
jgi:hypothetical protein